MSESAAVVTRVRYRERQFLRAADLVADQNYHMAMRRRHNIGGHRRGIVRGLALVKQPGQPASADAIVLNPGMAVDGYGRELIIHDEFTLPLESVFTGTAAGPVAADVWLVYARVAEALPQPGRRDCGPGQNNRWREEAHLRLTEVSSLNDEIDPNRPRGLSEDDAEFSPHQFPPDDPAKEWPVFLGRIKQIANGKYEIDADLNGKRPYAALVGELLTAASGQAQLQIGSESASDLRRFAVSLADSTGEWTDKLAIDLNKKTTVRGDTIVGGTLFAEGQIQFEPLASPPAAAAPWQIYRVTVEKDGKKHQQLRFEIGHPGKKDDPTQYQLAIGVKTGGDFKACLIVDADCTVRIPAGATLVMESGRIIEGPIQPDATDPRFIDEVQKQSQEWIKVLLNNTKKLSDDIVAAGIKLFGELEITQFNATDVTAGEPFQGAFNLQNQSVFRITGLDPDVKLVITKSDDTTEEMSGVVNPKGFNLEPGETKTVTVTSNELPSTADKLKVNVKVVGKDQLGHQVVEEISLEFPVQPPIPQIA